MSERAQLPSDLSLSRGAPTRRWMPILAAGLSIGQYARSVMHRVAALTAVLLVAIWALDGQGYLWPAWAWLGLAVPVLLVIAGTTGYALLEGWSLLDCLYMTVITITTVGFMEGTRSRRWVASSRACSPSAASSPCSMRRPR